MVYRLPKLAAHIKRQNCPKTVKGWFYLEHTQEVGALDKPAFISAMTPGGLEPPTSALRVPCSAS